MENELALFIEDLEFGLKTTSRAEDHKLYETYIAYAGAILSKVVLGAPKEEIFKVIDTNEESWTNSWLHAPIKGDHPESYRKFKELAEYPGNGETL